MSKRAFDTRVEVFDKRTGKLIKYQPYRLRVFKSAHGTVQVYERSGKFYYADGSECHDKSVLGLIERKQGQIVRKAEEPVQEAMEEESSSKKKKRLRASRLDHLKPKSDESQEQ